ncbi:hypothetical protein EIP86_007291 [Pleurotus ostreatoroseus]|nr:hypothetical protein EIP86_007291 [Pleurotus ostreatoroseus]
MSFLPQCSRSLRAFLGERSVWHTALLDVLAAKPLPYLKNKLSHLTVQELRKTCVRAAMVEQGFAHGRLALRPITAIKGDFTQVRLLPGATRYIAATTRGSLEVHHVGGERADALIPAPERAPIQIDLRVSPTSIKHAAILHILHWAHDLEYGGSTDIEVRLYELRGDSNLSLLRIHRPSSPRNIVFFDVQSTDSGAVFMYLRGRQEQGYTAEFHFVDFSESCRTLVARLRGWMMSSYLHNLLPLFGSIALLAPNRLLLATSEGTYLYDIPPPPVNDILELSPIWSSCSQLLARAPAIGPSLFSDNDRCCAHCVLWTGKDIIRLDFPSEGAIDHEPRHALYEVYPHFNTSSVSLGFNTCIQVLGKDFNTAVASKTANKV